MKKYKLIIIGGGYAGRAAAESAARFGTRVALIDDATFKKKSLSGCVATKAFIDCVEKIKNFDNAKEFGMEIIGAVKFSYISKQIYKTIEATEKNLKLEEEILNNIDVFKGKASFFTKNEISIEGGEIIQGEKIIIATGSRPGIPNIKGIDKIEYNTIDNIFDIEEIPNKLLIIGSGTTGIELAQGFSRLGSKVSVIDNSDSILKDEDEEIAHLAKAMFEEEGITFLLKSNIIELKESGNYKIATIRNGEATIELEFDLLIIAHGRVANIEGLNLEKVKIFTEEGKIKTDMCLKTNIDNIYAIGDVKGIFPSPHKGVYEAEIAVANTLFELKRSVRYDNLPAVTNTRPEVYHVGFNEYMARYGFNNVNVYRFNLNTSNSFLMLEPSESKGIIKIICDNKKRIIGAHAIGTNAGEFMQEITYAITHRHRIDNVIKVIHPYLSRVESIKECANLSWQQKGTILDNKGLTGFYKRLFKSAK